MQIQHIQVHRPPISTQSKPRPCLYVRRQGLHGPRIEDSNVSCKKMFPTPPITFVAWASSPDKLISTRGYFFSRSKHASLPLQKFARCFFGVVFFVWGSIFIAQSVRVIAAMFLAFWHSPGAHGFLLGPPNYQATDIPLCLPPTPHIKFSKTPFSFVVPRCVQLNLLYQNCFYGS